MIGIEEGGQRRRKRPRQEYLWKRNVRKSKNTSGKKHTTSRNKVKNARFPKNLKDFHETCHYKCEENFSENDRSLLYKTFWSLGEYSRQRGQLLKWIEQNPVARKQKTACKHRTTRNSFYFYMNDERFRVCSDFFHRILDISTKMTKLTLQKKYSICTLTNEIFYMHTYKRNLLYAHLQKKTNEEERHHIIIHQWKRQRESKGTSLVFHEWKATIAVPNQLNCTWKHH